MGLLGPQLEAFIAVAKFQTVYGAAKTIHITQTAVTQRLRALESKLATTLFVRTRRGMLLTSEGEALLRYCHTVQEQLILLNSGKTYTHELLLAWYARPEPPKYFSAIINTIS